MSMDETLVFQRKEDSHVRLTTALQTANLNPAIEFREGQFLFRKVNLDGGLVERFISHAAVKEAFSGVPVDSGWINLGTRTPAVVRSGDGRHGAWAIAYFPPDRYELEVTNEGTGKPYALERIRMPLPGLVFFGISNKYFAWAVKTEGLDPYQEIYRCPLPNVMQDASICWGYLSPPHVNVKTIFDAWRLFITSTFNNHMANAKSKLYQEDVRLRLKDMSWAPLPCSYPVADLVRQVKHTGVTLDQAIRSFFELKGMPS